MAKIRQIHEVLGIDSLPELEAAAHDGRLAKLPRFGPRTSENILKAIAFLRQASAFRLSHHAADEAEGLRGALERLPGVTSAIIAGDVRRRSEVVKDLVIVLVAESSPAELFRRLSQLPGVHEFAGQDERRLTLRFAGVPVPRSWPRLQSTSAQCWFRLPAARVTCGSWPLMRGTKDLPSTARLSGAAASSWPRRTRRPSTRRWVSTSFLRRSGREWAKWPRQPRGSCRQLVSRSDVKGFLHCHTSYSDGSNTVEELALACRAAGYGYLGVTDHSQAAAYAGGLRPDDLARQADEIDEVNSRLEGFRVLKGIEADILQDGRVDYDERVLERLDFVIASVHSRFNMGEKEMTARMLAAMDNPFLTIIGHPTGRLLLSRDPYPIDLDAVMDKAAATGVALEINADPHRLDLDWRVLRKAKERGVAISIGADAHSVAGLSYVDYGVGMARKGWLGPGDILNARPVGDFVAYARRRR